MVCNVKVYKVPGLHSRDDNSTRGLWVEVDLNDDIYVSVCLGSKAYSSTVKHSRNFWMNPLYHTIDYGFPFLQLLQTLDDSPGHNL